MQLCLLPFSLPCCWSLKKTRGRNGGFMNVRSHFSLSARRCKMLSRHQHFRRPTKLFPFSGIQLPLRSISVSASVCREHLRFQRMAIDELFKSHALPDPPNLPPNHSCYAQLRGDWKTARELNLHKHPWKGGVLLMSILFCDFFQCCQSALSTIFCCTFVKSRVKGAHKNLHFHWGTY